MARSGILKLLVGLAGAVLLSWPGLVEARNQAFLELRAKPNPAGLGETIHLECRLWAKTAAGQNQRVRGGLLQVSIIDLTKKTIVSQFVDKPNGQYDVFEFPWQASAMGEFKVECSYTGSAFLAAARTSTKLIVSRGRAGPGAGAVTKAAAPPPAQAEPRFSQPDLRPNASAGLVRPTVTASTTPRTSQKVETKVSLSAKPGAKPGEYLISLKVTTTGGQGVDEGDLLVTVSGGQIKPGQAGQALLSAAAGLQTLVWTVPAGQAKKARLEATYFGGPSARGEYRPSSSTLNLPPK